MQDLWLVGALGAVAAVVIAAPLLGPWSIRVRYLANAPMADPWTGLGLAPRPDMRVVRLSALESRDGDVEITVEEVDNHRAACIALGRIGCVPAAVAKLDGWMVLRTSLLMTADRAHVSLWGPDGTIADLRRVETHRPRACTA